MKKLNANHRPKTKVKRVVKVSAPRVKPTTKKLNIEIKITEAPPAPRQIVLVLDESGSMGSIHKQTVDGINNYIREMRSENCTLTLLKFSSNGTTYLYRSTPIRDVREMTMTDFIPSGYTPLYDAIGNGIRSTQGNDVVFVIMTDGQENASREFNQHSIRDMISAKRPCGWQFVFMGCDIDAYGAAGAMGLNIGSTISGTSNNFIGQMQVNARATKRFFASGGSGMSASMSSFYNDEDKLEVEKK